MSTFSIVIPTYNGADYIADAIESALKQTRPADEIIVSDDNSSDNTLELCKRYGDSIRIYENPAGPSGFVNGWNNAISHASSDFISILHQDDLLAPTFLEEIEKAFDANPDVKHLFVPCNYIDGKGKIKQFPDYCDGKIHRYGWMEYVNAYQTVGQPHIHRCPGVVTHRDIFKKVSYRAEAGHIADDDFFYRVGEYTDVIGILKTLASYREHENSETGHLQNSVLINRLANDYTFQVMHWINREEMPQKTFNYFINGAKHFIFQQFYFALENDDQANIHKAKENLTLLQSCGIENLMNIKMKFIKFYPICSRKAVRKVLFQPIRFVNTILNLK